MIKLLCHNDETKRPMLILGLSRANIEKLMEQKPIPVKVDEVIEGNNLDLLIIGGETEEAMVKIFTDLGWDMANVPTVLVYPNEHLDGGPREAT